MSLLAAFHNYIFHNDKDAENFLYQELYREILYWLQHHRPGENFIKELLQIQSDYRRTEPPHLETYQNLLDLGIKRLFDAVDYFLKLGTTKELYNFLEEVRLPFLAKLDEEEYRNLKTYSFSEIDFWIYELIGGDLPEESVDSFLSSTKDVDVWLVFRYFDEIQKTEKIPYLTEKLLVNLQSLPEKYILLAYYILRFPDLFQTVEESSSPFLSVSHVKGIPGNTLHTLIKTSYNFIHFGILPYDFFSHYPEDMEHLVLLVLLAMFELSSTELTPPWIEVFDRSMKNFWKYRYQYLHYKKNYQPLPEFTANIIHTLQDQEKQYIFTTSRMLAIFFENLNQYTNDTFKVVSYLFSFFPEFFEEEIRLHLDSMEKSKITKNRLEECAYLINKKIVKQSRNYELVDLEPL